MQTYKKQLLDETQIKTLEWKANMLDYLIKTMQTSDELKMHELCKYLALHQYNNKDYPLKTDMKKIDISNNAIDGFYAEAIQDKERVYIVVKGTDMQYNENFFTEPDIKDDYRIIYQSVTPKQLESAREFYNKIKSRSGVKEIIFVGYSLGGTIQQRLGAETGEKTITFNAIGAGDLKPKLNVVHSENITNYTNSSDIATLPFAHNQIGKTYIVHYKFVSGQNFHSLESMQSLETREVMTEKMKELYKPANKLYKTLIKILKPFYKKQKDKIENTSSSEISTNTTNKDSDVDYSTEVSAEIVNYNHKASKNQKKESENNSNNSGSECVGSYPVSGYTRADGVEVSDYIRSCGAAHAGNNSKSENKSSKNNIMEENKNESETKNTVFIPENKNERITYDRLPDNDDEYVIYLINNIHKFV